MSDEELAELQAYAAANPGTVVAQLCGLLTAERARALRLEKGLSSVHGTLLVIDEEARLRPFDLTLFLNGLDWARRCVRETLEGKA